MSLQTATRTQKAINVGMGQIAVAEAPDTLKTVLGSCIGLVILHPRFPVGAMAHVVLPDSSGRSGTAGKYADTALPELLRLLDTLGVNRSGRVAKIAGGAQMFAASGPMQVGDANIKAVTHLLAEAHIPIIGQDVGGKGGRRVTFDCASGDFLVETIGQPARCL